jgi:hypothetical protein
MVIVADYEVNVAFERDRIVLQATGHLDARAGQHLRELACIAVERLARPVQIDLAGVRSSTPGGAKLVTARELQRLSGMISLRTPGRHAGALPCSRTASG